MLDHPLSRPDLALVQDLLLTKIVLLLSQNASAEEWAFELGVLEDQSAGEWLPRNAFLLDYSLARLAATQALHLTLDIADAPTSGAGPAALAAPFVAAVAGEDGSRARKLWNELPRDEDGRRGTGLTLLLVQALSGAASSQLLDAALGALPKPYDAEASEDSSSTS